MIKIKINNSEFLLKQNLSVLEACKYVGINIPRFCYHETLSIAGNCRMCLVEIFNNSKPIASCALPIVNNMHILTNSPRILKARENVLETLLLNHPLDCPICDQGGECDLQDQIKLLGKSLSRFFYLKRQVEDKNFSFLIKTIMTRCIHCTRCIRFSSEISGETFLGTLNRGEITEIGNYKASNFNSEISGNLIDLCPVGALTSKTYNFKLRPWEMRLTESIDLSDSLGSNIYINFKETEILRIIPKNFNLINDNLISDKARFYFDCLTNRNVFSDFTLFNLLMSETKKNILILVNDELNISTYNFLQQISNIYSHIKIKNVTKTNNIQNFFTECLKDKINTIKKESTCCFIFSTNLKVESTILNTKIRTKYFNKEVIIFNLGYNYNNLKFIEFINFNITNIFLILEGKAIILSFTFLKTKNPLLFIGKSFNERILNSSLENIILSFKKIMPTVNIIKIEKFCNSVGNELFFNKPLGQVAINKAEIILALNLDNTIVIKKILLSYTKQLFWLNTHDLNLTNKKNVNNITIPNFFEETGLFLNLEARIQKNYQILLPITTFSIQSSFTKLFLQQHSHLVKNYSFCFNYLLDSLNSEKININIKSFNYMNNIFNHKILISFYPIKEIFSSFYTTNKYAKYSIFMNNIEQQNEITNTNY
jgi:NADH-quinone oxidoreductase subunit G